MAHKNVVFIEKDDRQLIDLAREIREHCARELEHCAFLMEQEEKPGAKHWRAAARWLRDGAVTVAAPARRT